MLALMLMMAAAEPVAPAYRPRPISAADQAEIKRQADEVLLDGPSTRWKWPARRREKLYCAEYNAKNAFGAYTGWKPYFFANGELTLVSGDAFYQKLHDTMCSNAGYIPKIEGAAPSTPQP